MPRFAFFKRFLGPHAIFVTVKIIIIYVQAQPVQPAQDVREESDEGPPDDDEPPPETGHTNARVFGCISK